MTTQISKRPLIFHPQKNQWVELAETVLVDGILQVRWENPNESGLMSLDTAQLLFKIHGVMPF